MKNAVAEIVTFALAEGITNESFVEISKGTEAFVRAQPGFVHRQLSRGEDGRWTDYVVWETMDNAKSAAAAFMADGCTAELMKSIVPDSANMRHENLLWDMAA
ncbi:hypothetical protein A9Q94_01210 [Rhodobacterales bacterium 56_14_T64]|nr:hypothetical protein A9Q94_01210 [Rhodobacterales bacterium 56_14_T64]